MRSTQDKFLELLDKSLPKTTEVVRDMAYVNTGTLRIQPKDSFGSLVQIDYNFQPTSVTLFVKPSDAVGSIATVVGYQGQIVLPPESERLGLVIENIVEYVKAAVEA
jgi:hypothetical protein